MDRRIIPVFALLLAGGFVLSISAYIYGIFPFDQEVARQLRDFHHPLFTAAMGSVSYLGNGSTPVILVSVAAIICAIRKKWLEAFFVVATLSVVVIDGVLKVLVGRPRPSSAVLPYFNPFESVNQFSYPSGHVLFYVVFFGFLAYLSWVHLTGRLRLITSSACIVLIVLIGPSRIFLGVHWMSDIIGSYIIGILWLIALIILYQRMLRIRMTPHPMVR